ncbi:hypothetical protein HYU95_05730 [Candidatus Daviesbacteria bacterium]|nr:hypothetical protein [Candidatus Daviesbacteria bacterium]
MVEQKQKLDPEQRYTRLAGIIGQRRDLLDRIGAPGSQSPWEIKPEEKVVDYSNRVARMGRVKQRVKSCIERLEEKAEYLNQEAVSTRESLILQAEGFLTAQNKIAANIAIIEPMVAEHNIPQEALDSLRAEYENFSSLPAKDPNLARGIKLYNARKQAEAEAVAAATAEPVGLVSEEGSTEEEILLPPKVPSGMYEVTLPDGTVTEETEEKSELTPHQIAILCTAIKRKDGWSIRYGPNIVAFKVDRECREVCQRLDGQSEKVLPAISGLTSQQIQAEREQTLGVMRDLVAKVVELESEGERDYLDSLPSDIQHLVIQFMDWESRFSATNLYDFLAFATDERDPVVGEVGYAEAHVRELKGFEKVWDASQPIRVEEIPAPIVVVSPVEDEKPCLIAHPLSRLPEEEIQVSPEEPNEEPVICKTKAQLRKEAAAQRKETRDQTRQERVNACIDQIYRAFEHETTLKLPRYLDISNLAQGNYSGSVIAKSFPAIKSQTQRGLIEGRILRPGVREGSGNNPIFSIIDIALMLYHQIDRQMTAKMTDELRELIIEGIIRKEKELQAKKA